MRYRRWVGAWGLLGSWIVVLLVAVVAGVTGVAWLRRGTASRPRRIAVWFLAVWFVLTGSLLGFLMSSASVGDTTCNGTTVDATHEVQTGDLGSTGDPVFTKCTDNARTRYLLGMLGYVGLVGAGAAAVRQLGSSADGGSRDAWKHGGLADRQA